MLRTHKKCRVCQEISHNTTLLEKIFESSFFVKYSKVNLSNIQKQYDDKFSYDSLLNHVKKHQFMSEEDFNSRHMKQIAKKAERQILQRQIESKEVWDEVIEQGMDKLKKGELSMKTADLLKAAKDKSDHEMKVKDQQIAMMDMVFHFASGENTESRKYDRRIIEGQEVTDFDLATDTPGRLGAGEDGPSGIYYPPTGDAAPPGSGEVSP